MTIATVLPESACGLPDALRGAQEAIRFPEVQGMLRKLSKYGLGIFMPHIHDDETGALKVLPDDAVQVESGLEVYFQSTEEIAHQTEHFLPVGWLWRAGASTPSAVCEMVGNEGQGDSEGSAKHKLKRARGSSSILPASLARQRLSGRSRRT